MSDFKTIQTPEGEPDIMVHEPSGEWAYAFSQVSFTFPHTSIRIPVLVMTDEIKTASQSVQTQIDSGSISTPDEAVSAFKKETEQ